MTTAIHLVWRLVWLTALTIGTAIAVAIAALVQTGRLPALLRRYFEACGGAFIKLGQMLAIRYDLLPPNYCDEFSNLFRNIKPEPLTDVYATIVEDLGASPAEIFSCFDSSPVATASIAQVHRATLKADQTAVAVKIRRRRMTRQLVADIKIARIIAWVFELSGLFSDIRWQLFYFEFKDLLEQELDFRAEARNLTLFASVLAQDSIAHSSPRVFTRFSGNATLTTEWVDGVLLQDYLSSVSKYASNSSALMQPRRIAHLLLHSLLVQCFTNRLFHADPHPANIIISKAGYLVYLDLGAIGHLDERTWSQQVKLRQYLAVGMIHAAYETLLDSLTPLPSRDLSVFEAEVKRLMISYRLACSSKTATTDEKSSARFLLGILASIRRHRLVMSANTVRLFRAAITSDSILLKLDPELDWLAEFRKYMSSAFAAELADGFRREKLLLTAYSILLNATAVPQVLGDFLDWSQNRLPQLGRWSQLQMSLIEQICLLTLRWIQLFAIVAGIAALGTAIFGYPEWLEKRIGALPAIRFFLPAFCLATTILIGRLLLHFRK